jgi:hypothetical protein
MKKKQFISQTEILEYWSVDETLTKIGGVDNLKEWLKKTKNFLWCSSVTLWITNSTGFITYRYSRDWKIFDC